MSAFNYIKAHRRRWNLTQKELGFLLGYSGNTRVSFIESGEQKPNAKELIALELLFETSISQLFPDLYMDISNKMLRRLSDLEDFLSEEPLTQDISYTLTIIRRVRESIATDNAKRV